jgi:hypothetical protein
MRKELCCLESRPDLRLSLESWGPHDNREFRFGLSVAGAKPKWTATASVADMKFVTFARKQLDKISQQLGDMLLAYAIDPEAVVDAPLAQELKRNFKNV